MYPLDLVAIMSCPRLPIHSNPGAVNNGHGAQVISCSHGKTENRGNMRTASRACMRACYVVNRLPSRFMLCMAYVRVDAFDGCHTRHSCQLLLVSISHHFKYTHSCCSGSTTSAGFTKTMRLHNNFRMVRAQQRQHQGARLLLAASLSELSVH
jgi:hypothetical protein